MRTFVSLREWATPADASNEVRTIIRKDRRPIADQVRQYNGPEALGVAATIPGVEDGIAGRRDIVLKRLGTLYSAGNESFKVVSIT